MAFGELYTALENKTVDGQENPYSVILSNKFFEVQKFVSATNHTYTQNILIVSKKFWDRLSPAEQTALREAAVEAGRFERTASRDYARKASVTLEQQGMKINDVPAAEVAKMRDAVKPTLDRLDTRTTLLTFSAAEGAGGHQETLNRALAETLILDWLDDTLA